MSGIVVAEGVVEVSADGKHIPKDIAKDIDAGGKQIENAGGVMGGKLSDGIKSGVTKVGVVVGATLLAATAAIGVGVGAMVGNGVRFQAEMQNYTAAFTPLLGGADAAQAKLKELSVMGASTPFELGDLAQASQTLLSFGTTSENLLPQLQMLGDISQGNAEKFSGLSLVFGQVQSAGRLMGGDVLQMINQGFNPLVEIAKTTGESMVDLKARMEAGGVSFEEVQGAMQSATAEGGMFYDAMALGSRTLTGSFSSTKDGVNILSGSVVGNLTPALTGLLSDGINPMLGALTSLVNGEEGAQAAVDSAGDALVDQVSNIGPAIEGLAGNLGTIFTAIGPALGSAVTTIVNSLATILPAVIGLASTLILTLATALVSNLPTLVATAVPLILGFATSLLAMLPMLIQAGVGVLLALVTGITSSLPTLIPGVVTAIVGAITTLFAPENLTALLGAGLQLIMGLVTGLLAALPSLIAALPAIIVGIITFLVDAIPTLIDAGIQLFLSLINALPTIITGIVTAIPKIITGLITALTGAIPKIITAGVSLFVSLIKNLPTIITSIVGSIPQIITSIYNTITSSDMIGKLAKAGGELIKGLWNGIKDLGKWLNDKISGFFGGVVDNIKAFFGIKSPSRLMRDEVGTMLGLGVGGGFITSLLGQRAGIMGALGTLVDGVTGEAAGIAVDFSGTPGGGSGLSGLGPSGPPPGAAQLASPGGDTIHIDNITLDAASVKDFTDVVNLIKALPQVARAGRGRTAPGMG